MTQVREWLAAAYSVVAFTGSGISAESGIPTFRGSGGLWREFRAEDLATPEAFGRDPKLVWSWYEWRRCLIAAAEPNAGHRALVELENRKPQFTVVTQNVDGLHQRAGSANVIALHGDIWALRCAACGCERRDERAPLPELPPRCECGAVMRPGVVWFGESLPVKAWDAAERAVEKADVMLVVGTSAVVYPAAALVNMARNADAKIVEINPERTPLTPFADCSLKGPAGEVLPRLIA